MSDLSDNVHAREALWKRVAAGESIQSLADDFAALDHQKGLLLDPNDVPDPGPDPEPEPPTGQILHGAFRGVSWPGPLEVEDVHIGQSGWSGHTNAIGNWPTNRPLMSNIGLWPKQFNGSLSAAAGGSYDDEHRTNARAIKARTAEHVWAKLGHEANSASVQPWGWSNAAELALYKQAFDRIAKVYKAELGAQVTMVFCPGGWGLTVTTLRDWLPAEAQAIFLDVYDRWKDAPADCRPGGGAGWEARRYTRRNKVAVDAVFQVSKEKGLRSGYGEFGLCTVATGGGGDNAYFIQQVMTAERNASNADADAYHQSDSSTGASADHAIGQFPNAWAELQRQYALS
jgi:hypothetical protein